MGISQSAISRSAVMRGNYGFSSKKLFGRVLDVQKCLWEPFQSFSARWALTKRVYLKIILVSAVEIQSYVGRFLKHSKTL